MDIWSYVLALGSALFTGGAAWQRAESGLKESKKDIEDAKKHIDAISLAAHQRIDRLENRIDGKLDDLGTKTDDMYKILINLSGRP